MHMSQSLIDETNLPSPDAPWEPVDTQFIASKEALAKEAASATAWQWYQRQLETFPHDGHLPDTQSALLSMLVMEYKTWRDHKGQASYQPPTQMVRAVLNKLNAQMGNSSGRRAGQ
jgi:hypothetical protein